MIAATGQNTVCKEFLATKFLLFDVRHVLAIFYVCCVHFFPSVTFPFKEKDWQSRFYIAL